MRLDGDRRSFLIAMSGLGISAGIHVVTNNLFSPERSEVGTFYKNDQTVLIENPYDRSARAHTHWNTEIDNSELLLRILGYRFPVSTVAGSLRNGMELDSLGTIHGTISRMYDYSSPFFHVFNLVANRLAPPNGPNNTTALTHIYINEDYIRIKSSRKQDMT